MSKRLTPQACRQIKTLLANGVTQRAIAKATGYSKALIGNVGRGDVGRYGDPIPSIESVLGPRKTTPEDPTPDEIAEACDKLRRQRPRPGAGHGWTAPVYSALA